jgi:hypothetical protein
VKRFLIAETPPRLPTLILLDDVALASPIATLMMMVAPVAVAMIIKVMVVMITVMMVMVIICVNRC